MLKSNRPCNFICQLPHLWSSKLQSIIALSMTEAEYIALSAALRDVICILQLVTELQENGFQVPTQGAPKVSCRVFKDNAGALELANNPKLRPRTNILQSHIITSDTMSMLEQSSLRRLQLKKILWISSPNPSA